MNRKQCISIAVFAVPVVITAAKFGVSWAVVVVMAYAAGWFGGQAGQRRKP